MDNVVTYKCPNCDSNVKYNIARKALYCEYCKTEYNEEKINELNQIIQVKCYECSSCGAKVFFDDNDISDKCAYCGGAFVLDDKLKNMVKPSKILPFKVDKEKVKKYIFSKNTDIINMDILGVYVPYWLYNLSSRIESEDNTYELHFYDIPVDASIKISDELSHELEPFDYMELKEFLPSYLSGFYAERYSDVSYNSHEKILAKLKNNIPTILKQSMNVDISFGNSRLKNYDVKSKYILLPIWVVSCEINNEKKIYFINGQTGKCVEDVYDKMKLNKEEFELEIIEDKNKVTGKQSSKKKHKKFKMTELKIFLIMMLILLGTFVGYSCFKDWERIAKEGIKPFVSIFVALIPIIAALINADRISSYDRYRTKYKNTYKRVKIKKFNYIIDIKAIEKV